MPNRVSEAQWNILLDFLTKHPQLAKTGYNNTARGRLESRRLWAEVAKVLNAQGIGAIKNGPTWAKYYHDKRSKLKVVVGGNVADSSGTGGGPPQGRPLTVREERWCGILGEGFGQGETNVRVVPVVSQPQPSTSSAPPYMPDVPGPTEQCVVYRILDNETAATPPRQAVINQQPPAVASAAIPDLAPADTPNLTAETPDLAPAETAVLTPAETAPTEAHPLPIQRRQRHRSRTRPLGPLEEARRILSQIETQRVQADMATAAAFTQLAQNVGELARQHGRIADELFNIRQMMERQFNQ